MKYIVIKKRIHICDSSQSMHAIVVWLLLGSKSVNSAPHRLYIQLVLLFHFNYKKLCCHIQVQSGFRKKPCFIVMIALCNNKHFKNPAYFSTFTCISIPTLACLDKLCSHKVSAYILYSSQVRQNRAWLCHTWLACIAWLITLRNQRLSRQANPGNALIIIGSLRFVICFDDIGRSFNISYFR